MNGREYPKDWLSIDADDDGKDYLAFEEFLTDDTSRKSKVAANQIIELGESMLNEIDEKKKLQDAEKEELIQYIFKKSKKYSPKILREYDISDVRDIHAEVVYENRSILRKLFELF